MNPVRFWLAIVSLLAFVVVAPAWLHFAGPAADPLPGETEFLVATMLPIALILTIASWVQPG